MGAEQGLDLIWETNAAPLDGNAREGGRARGVWKVLRNKNSRS